MVRVPYDIRTGLLEKKFMADHVECHSDYTYAERPIAMTWEGRRLEIVEIPVQWHTPNEKCFRVLTSDGQEFELSYQEATDEWHIHQP